MTSSASVAVAGALAAWLVGAPARADATKDQCIDRSTQGQDLLHDLRLGAAREMLLACADAACPKMIRDDCTRHLEELEQLQPTLVFVVRDGAGGDLSAVQVTLDGAPWVDRLEGKPLPVDPGSHVFVLTAKDLPPVTRTLVVVEREKSRRELVELSSAPAAPPPAAAPPPVAPPPSAPPPAAPPPAGMTTIRLAGLVTGGAGVVAVGVGAIFGVLTGVEWNRQTTHCGSTSDCPDRAAAAQDHSALTTDGAVSTVAFVAGGALLATGAALFFVGGNEESATGTIALSPGIAPGGASLALGGAF